MSLDAWVTIGILTATFVALLATKLPPATVFLGALTLSVTFGLAPLDRSLAGFSNSGVLTIAALFIVAGLCEYIMGNKEEWEIKFRPERGYPARDTTGRLGKKEKADFGAIWSKLMSTQPLPTEAATTVGGSK